MKLDEISPRAFRAGMLRSRAFVGGCALRRMLAQRPINALASISTGGRP